jgi:hypothetical protein
MSEENAKKPILKKEIEEDIGEFRKRNAHEMKSICSSFNVPIWILAMVLALLVLTAVAFLASTLVILIYKVKRPTVPIFPNNQVPGASCSSTSQCIKYAYCSKISGQTTGTCVCSTKYYYDSATASECTLRKAKDAQCASTTECQTFANLKCISLTCICDSSTDFWNSTAAECQPKKPLFEYCISASESTVEFSVCTSNRLVCQTDYYFDPLTGKCVQKLKQGVQCSSTSQCIQFAYCNNQAGASSNAKCYCDPLYTYHSNLCNSRVASNGASCSITPDQCDLAYRGLKCNSVSNTCTCDSTTENWDVNLAICVKKMNYGQTCTANSDCITGTCAFPDFEGTRKVCRCTATDTYYDEVTDTCLPSKLYNQPCEYRYQCINPEYSQCMKFGFGTIKRCYCIPNYSYLDASTQKCMPKKSRTSACVNDYECQDYANYNCILTAPALTKACACKSTHFYDTTLKLCKWKGRYGDYCTGPTECSSGTCTLNVCS